MIMARHFQSTLCLSKKLSQQEPSPTAQPWNSPHHDILRKSSLNPDRGYLQTFKKKQNLKNYDKNSNYFLVARRCDTFRWIMKGFGYRHIGHPKGQKRSILRRTNRYQTRVFGLENARPLLSVSVEREFNHRSVHGAGSKLRVRG